MSGFLQNSGGGGGGGTITGGGVVPQIALWTGASSIGGSAKFTYQDGMNILTQFDNTGTHRVLYSDASVGQFSFGQFDPGGGNGTFLTIDDTIRTMTFSANSSFVFKNNQGDTSRWQMVHSAGNPASLYLGEAAGNPGGEVGAGRNTGVGYFVGSAMTTGSDDSFFGQASGFANTTGALNSFFGSSSGRFNTIGSRNSFFGEEAGYTNVVGNDNFFGGYKAGFLTTTDGNVFIGASAGVNNGGGYGHTFIGFQAGASNAGAINNTYIGLNAAFRNNNNDNVVIGNTAGFGGIAANYDRMVVIGNFAGQALLSNGASVLIGFNAGNGLTGGNAVMIGYEAGAASSGAFSNVFIGYHSGILTGSGANNMFLGALSGQNNTTGSFNVFMGDNSGLGCVSGSGNILLGSGSLLVAGTEIDSIGLGRDVAISESHQLLFGSAGHPIYSAALGDYTGAQNNTWVEVNDNIGIIGLHGGQITKRRDTADAAVVITLLDYILTGTGLTVNRVYSLPAIGGAVGEAPEATTFIIKNKSGSAANITLTPNGADTIDGAATVTIIPGDSATVVSDGVSDWEVI